MKTCSRCEQKKTLDFFNKKAKSPDGYNSWCKECLKNYERERYQNGDNVRKQFNKKRTIQANRARLVGYLRNHPCVDCKESDELVLEFDHRDPATKRANVCEMLSLSWSTIEIEIAKCDVRCANCHRRRTHKQFNWWGTSGL